MHSSLFVNVGGVPVTLYAVALVAFSLVLGTILLMDCSEEQNVMGVALVLSNLIVAYGINCSITGGCTTYASVMFALYMINTFLIFNMIRHKLI